MTADDERLPRITEVFGIAPSDVCGGKTCKIQMSGEEFENGEVFFNGTKCNDAGRCGLKAEGCLADAAS